MVSAAGLRLGRMLCGFLVSLLVLAGGAGSAQASVPAPNHGYGLQTGAVPLHDQISESLVVTSRSATRATFADAQQPRASAGIAGDGCRGTCAFASHEFHTYYVMAGQTPVLVHNAGPCPVGPLARNAFTPGEVIDDPALLRGLTPSQVDDLARAAGYEVMPGSASAVNPATRYYLPGTNGSVGFRVLEQGVPGQPGIKAGPYIRFFGGQRHKEQVPLAGNPTL